MAAVPDADTAFDPAQALAEGFAQQLQAWALARGATPQAAAAAHAAARAVSLAGSQGHVCWPLAETGLDASLLLASHVVGTPAAPGACPLVLDPAGGGRLYLHRHFDHEQALARRLVQATLPLSAMAGPAGAPQHRTPGPADLAGLMRTLFPPAPGGVSGQQLAAALALRQRLVVVSGGPGTGKTTTVVQLLALLLAAEPGCRIALAAPTGKAAARMAQALQARAASLPAALRQGLPVEARTVHRLLGGSGTLDGSKTLSGNRMLDTGGAENGFHHRFHHRFEHHAGNPLPIDALVVDEASMLDLALARRLLDAVPAHARIVLLGDKDQLSAVEAGAVFSDLSASPALTPATRQALADACGVSLAAIQVSASDAPAALPDSVVWLTHNHRFAADSAIGRLAAAVRAGHTAQAQALLRAGGTALALHAPGATALAQARAGYAAYIDACIDAVGGDVSSAGGGIGVDAGGAADISTLAPARGGEGWGEGAVHAQGLAAGGPVGSVRSGSLRADGHTALSQQAGPAAPVAAPIHRSRSTSGQPASAGEPVRQAVQAAPTVRAIHQAFAAFRALSALRAGPQGTDALNQQIAHHVRARLAALQPGGADALSPWFAGRPVIVLRNDDALGLFNGDIGIALPAGAAAGAGASDAGALQVWFEDPSQPGGYRAVEPARLPAHETAFAMTVHKAQGSEFDAVLVLLPAAAGRAASRALTRELLYTAVTRARQHVAVAATPAAVAAAVATPTQRHSGLHARLQDAMTHAVPSEGDEAQDLAPAESSGVATGQASGSA